MTDVRLGPRVTLLAESAGSHGIPQPQASRHALSNKLDRSVVPFLIKLAQAQLMFTFTPNAPSRGLSRPSNIMLGIMRSRHRITSANGASHTLPSSHNLHYIKCPQPPLRGSVACGKAAQLFMASAVPQLAHGVRCVPRPTPALVVPWPCSCPRSNQLRTVLKHRQSRGWSGWSAAARRSLVSRCAKSVKPVSDRVCQRAQPVKAKPFGRSATLTVLRALAVVNH